MLTAQLHLTEALSVKQGGTYVLPLELLQAGGTPYDLTGCTAIAQIRRRFSEETATAFTVTFGANRLLGTLTLSLTAEQAAALQPGKYEWDLFLNFPGGQVWPVLEGDLVVRARVSRE